MKPVIKTVLQFVYYWFLSFFFLFNNSVLAQSSEELLTEQNYRTLSGRVRAILEVRLQGLNNCDKNTQKTLQEKFNSLYSYSNRKADVLIFLDLYQESLNVDYKCRQSLDAAENNFHKMERSKFSFIHKSLDLFCSKNNLINPSLNSECVGSLSQILRDLDPHCMSTQVPNPKEYYDGLPCLSGDNLIGRMLLEKSNAESLAKEMQEFMGRLRIDLGNKEKREYGIELYNSFLGKRQDSMFLRKKFLAVIALYTSSMSSYASNIEGYHDMMWRTMLIETKSSERALQAFNKIRISVDDFRTLKSWMIEKKLNVTMTAQKLSKMNRHDYMAAFLACYYKERSPSLQKLVPLALGYAYESLDFVSHLREGITFHESVENFSKDTGRYRYGVQWGSLFCRAQ